MGESARKVAVDSVIEAMMTRPDDFTFGGATVKDTKTGYEYWTACGIMSAGIYNPYELAFGLVQGWRFMKALRGLKVHQLTEKNKKAASEGG